jgi:hypothetical protein
MEWQPIATAPKDTTIILAYRRQDVFTAQYISPAQILGPDHDHEERWWTSDGEDLTGNMFTHWMPLPEPPE